MPKERPCVLSIAGFDPSGGAGVLADIKTFEANKVLGFGVVTGLTFQNEKEFDGVQWIDTNEILKQTELLFKKYKIEFIKVGMIKDLETLSEITDNIKRKTSNVKFIWDPIIKASAGFEIHKTIDKEKVIELCKNSYLITPNIEEIRMLMSERDEMKAVKELSKYCNVFLKGGHSDEKKGRDYLFASDGKVFPFRAKKISETGKHGSGCVLSSAITSNLAKESKLQRACLEGKEYVTKFLMSNKKLLGYHKV